MHVSLAITYSIIAEYTSMESHPGILFVLLLQFVIWISCSMLQKTFEFLTCIHEIQMEGSVSQKS